MVDLDLSNEKNPGCLGYIGDYTWFPHYPVSRGDCGLQFEEIAPTGHCFSKSFLDHLFREYTP